jgi:putative phage-type endonuclease
MFSVEERVSRATGIGASEIAAIVGLSPFSTALDVYLDKLGLSEPRGDTRYTRWGRRLEAVIADRYGEELGVEMVESPTLRHSRHEWMLATPDRIHADGSRLVEIKNVSASQTRDWGEVGTSEVPERYYLQVIWQMAVTDVKRADIAVLIGGHDFRVYSVERDQTTEAYLVEAGRQFWFDHIIAQVPPEFDDDAAVSRYLTARHPRDNGQTLEATGDIDVWIDRLREARAVIDEAEAARLEAENQIKAFMGDASTLVSRLGRVTYRATRDTTHVDWRAAAEAANVRPEIIAAHTTVRPGARRFLPRFTGALDR